MLSVKGYLWGFCSDKRQIYEFDALHSLSDDSRKAPPYIDVEESFVIDFTPKPRVHDCYVTVQCERFLVSGWFDPQATVNQGMRRRFPHFIWRGEVSVLCLGTLVHYRKKAYNVRRADRAVLEFVARYLLARDLHINMPPCIKVP
ncbi:hypothetical protein DENSPDRAFT_887207 [Dentipellis sp. KUC8613]|nr:hypothetical protein DENSPDRAFT_887207 [Dentipellis sp. KUC8613]